MNKILELNTSVENLHIKWIQTMFQMVTAGFVASTFLKKSGKEFKKYMLIPHIIGFLSIILGIYSIYYTYIIDENTIYDKSRIKYSKYITILILVSLLLVSLSIFVF